jgi:mono/diheme cytochrome c family protein
MRKAAKFFLVWLILGAVFLWSPGLALAQYEPGKAIYQGKCAICHGRDGKGDGPLRASFSPTPTDFTNPAFWQGKVNDKIRETIENGYGPMPAMNLDSGQIKAVTDYMSHTFKK